VRKVSVPVTLLGSRVCFRGASAKVGRAFRTQVLLFSALLIAGHSYGQEEMSMDFVRESVRAWWGGIENISITGWAEAYVPPKTFQGPQVRPVDWTSPNRHLQEFHNLATSAGLVASDEPRVAVTWTLEGEKVREEYITDLPMGAQMTTVTAYDGHHQRTLRVGDSPPLSGGIGPRGKNPIAGQGAKDLIGRMGHHSLIQLLDLDTATVVDANLVVNGEECCRVELQLPEYVNGMASRVVFDLAKNKGWLPVRRQVFLPESDLLSQEYNVLEFEEFDGVSFPAIVTYEAYLHKEDGSSSLFIRTMCGTDDVKLNQELPSDFFSFDFPDGTVIWDNYVGAGYTVGSPEYLAKRVTSDVSQLLVAASPSSEPEDPGARRSDLGEATAESGHPILKALPKVLLLVAVLVLGAGILVRVLIRRERA